MSWNALRKGRFSQKNACYFVTFVTQHRYPYFLDFQAAALFCKELQSLEYKQDSTWLSWVLMPDHFHGIIQLKSDLQLSDIICRLKSKTAIEINRLLQRKGKLWQSTYYDHYIRQEDDLIGISRYIIANPKRANIVNSVANYPFWNSVYL